VVLGLLNLENSSSNNDPVLFFFFKKKKNWNRPLGFLDWAMLDLLHWAGPFGSVHLVPKVYMVLKPYPDA